MPAAAAAASIGRFEAVPPCPLLSSRGLLLCDIGLELGAPAARPALEDVCVVLGDSGDKAPARFKPLVDHGELAGIAGAMILEESAKVEAEAGCDHAEQQLVNDDLQQVLLKRHGILPSRCRPPNTELTSGRAFQPRHARDRLVQFVGPHAYLGPPFDRSEAVWVLTCSSVGRLSSSAFRMYFRRFST
jgi:hypothetical protein